MNTDKKAFFEALFKDLQPSYTQEEAKAAIDKALEKYGPTVRITFRRTNAEIIDSYKVDVQEDRYRCCEILRRSGVTKRDVEDLAAEWMVHNVAYKMNVGKKHARDVSLDYDRDPHLPVRVATGIFDALDIE